MKRSQLVSALTLLAVFIITSRVPYAATNGAVQKEFRIEEYELFHDVLEPLQHEALPQGDFQRIRSMASELVTRGKAIVKLGVPPAPKTNRRDFAKALRTFDRALAKFKAHAKSGSNARLEESFTIAHDSFEKLADLVPTMYPSGSPPAVLMKCPGSAEAGTKITLTAVTFDDLSFLWSISAGNILTGQGTPSITIDTRGLAGETISVSVVVNDGSGLTAFAKCEVQISASKPLQSVSDIEDRFVRREFFLQSFP
jgi:hypothetical protein